MSTYSPRVDMSGASQWLWFEVDEAQKVYLFFLVLTLLFPPLLLVKRMREVVLADRIRPNRRRQADHK